MHFLPKPFEIKVKVTFTPKFFSVQLLKPWQFCHGPLKSLMHQKKSTIKPQYQYLVYIQISLVVLKMSFTAVSKLEFDQGPLVHLAVRLFFFFCETGVWTQGFILAKQAPYHLNHTSSLFCSGCFGDRGLMNSLPLLASNCDPLNLSLTSS
jgi:hypothetical protein